MYSVVYFKDVEGLAYPCETEAYEDMKSVIMTVKVNKRADGYKNTFIVLDDGYDDCMFENIYVSPMASEYFINIYDYIN